MSAILDTSMIVRYLTGDPPALAEQAAQVIDHVEDLIITPVSLTETAYVLTSVYKVPRELVVDSLIQFINKQNIRIFALDKNILLQALLLCRPSGRISFSDAMIWASAHATEVKIVYTFDQRFPYDGVEIRSSWRD